MNVSQARVVEIETQLKDTEEKLVEMDQRLNLAIAPLIERETQLSLEIQQRTKGKENLERQLAVMKQGGKMQLKLMNEVKRIGLELDQLIPELRPLRQRIVSVRLKGNYSE